MRKVFPVSVRHTSVALMALMVSSITFGGVQAQDVGFGDKIPMGIAVKQIVPDNYTVKFGQGVDPSSAVSWKGGTWRSALDTASKSADLRAVVTGQTVTIVRANGTQVDPASASDVDKSKVPEKKRAPRRTTVTHRRSSSDTAHSPETNVFPGGDVVSAGGFVLVSHGSSSEAAPAQGNTHVQSGPTTQEWTVRKGDNLHTVLSDWAARENWSVVWKSDYEYRLTGDAVFRGDFVTSSTELMRSMREVRPLVTAKFFEGNKTLVVGNDANDESN